MSEVKLWCAKCQAGVGGKNKENIYSVGDKCPLCLTRGRNQDFGLLEDAEKYSQELQRIGSFKKEEAARKAIRGQKTVEDHVRESTEELNAKIAQLEKMINKKNKTKGLEDV